MTNGRYALVENIPDARTLLDVRGAAGLTVYAIERAEIGIANSLYGVSITCDDVTIGIGRVIGDGGFFYDITDIAVRPEHQGRGVGKMIMSALMKWVNANAPDPSFVSLHADEGASGLYEKFGFRSRGQNEPGMVWSRERYLAGGELIDARSS